MSGRADTPPRRLGGFEIERELGRGGMGVVYLARDPRLERRVALKTLPEEMALDPDRLAQFQREARVLASLDHPSIAILHGMEEDGRGSRFLVLEWVDGITLAERLKHGRPPLDEALFVCAQIAEALAAAHAAGVVHRDLKPGNVMVLPGGRAKVLDFGLARRTGGQPVAMVDAQGWIDSGISGLDGSHVLFGTAGYLSPERVMGEPEDAGSDIFSFGCVAYECLAGRPAFHGSSVLGVLTRVVRGEPDWGALSPDLPAELPALLSACLDKTPSRRPASMKAVSSTLRRVLERGRSGPAVRDESGAPAKRLPRTPTSFVGRDREVSACLRLLERAPLLTLTGAGGCGKTRLALRVADLASDRPEQELGFAALAPIQDPARVPDAVAAAFDVRLRPGVPPLDDVVARIGEARALLLLDNGEHVREAAGAASRELLARCPGLRVLATSRQELGVAGETLFPVPPMSLPGPDDAPGVEAALRHESVRLFAERAAAVDRGFELSRENLAAVVDVCRRVEGIPLAIELAAARVRVLAPAEIAARLDRPLRLLRSEDPAESRHATLRATIEWSVELLDPGERRAFRALAAFAGGWALDEAAAVLGVDEDEALDAIGGLASRSLVETERRGDAASRHRFLEPVRQYAREALVGAGEEAAVRDRHLDFFAALARRAKEGLAGPEQGRWVERLEADHENLLAALDWCANDPRHAGAAQDLAADLVKFWFMRGHVRTGRAALARALAHPAGRAPTRARGRALYAAGALEAFGDEAGASEPHFEEALAIARALDDRREAARCLSALGAYASRHGDQERATRHLEEAAAFFRETGDHLGQSTILANLAANAWNHGDHARAAELYRSAIGLLREVGELNNLAQACVGLAFVSIRSGDPAGAGAALDEAFRTLDGLKARNTLFAGALLAAGERASALGHHEEAARLLGAADALLGKLGLRFGPTDVWWKERPACDARGRDTLGDARWRALCEEGAALPTVALDALVRAEAAPGA